MTVAALLDAGVAAGPILDGVASLGLPVRLEIEKVRKGGFAATQVRVEAPEEQSHRFLPEVEAILAHGRLSGGQRELALKIFRRLAEAEAAVHGLPLDKVHFHEVGALDSIVDIAAAAIGLDLLGVERITSSPVPTGTGMVSCAHGLMPIPAPGTAHLLRGVPLRATSIKAELTTPTGAAILTSVAQEYVELPDMTVEAIGHGAGRRELVEQPNVLRLFVGRTELIPSHGECDRVWVLETNLDDLPAEMVGYCYDLLLSQGALDVFTTPIFMKKNRPGILLSVLAPEASVAALEDILFRETTTFGIRRYRAERQKLQRRPCTVTTPWGPVRGKLGWREGRPPLFSPEYDDCARIAREHGVALREVYAQAVQSYSKSGYQDGPPNA
jgi:uncharacterized protein (TIGR00299 family) protein